MIDLPSAYQAAASNDEIATAMGLDISQIIRFDSNTPARPPDSVRPATVAKALFDINEYDHGGYPKLVEAIAAYNGVEPQNIVLGNGSGDLIFLATRAFLSRKDIASIFPKRTFPLYQIAIESVGATVGDQDASLSFVCNPNNPTGELVELPNQGLLVVDEAYGEYCNQPSAVSRIDSDVIVLRTFSKAFGLASARVGYAIANSEIVMRLKRFGLPHPISAPSAALALAALENPLDVSEQINQRERLKGQLIELGFSPLPSETNFLFVPTKDAGFIAEQLLKQGLVIRAYEDGLRISVRDQTDDDILIEALAQVRDPGVKKTTRPTRVSRVTAETAIRVRLDVYGQNRVYIKTGSGLYDHLLEALSFNAGFNLMLEGIGDLETGDHHSAEDAAIALGQALDEALGDRKGLSRYGSSTIPMDEAIASATVDISGRAFWEIELPQGLEMQEHVLRSFAQAARLTLHVKSDGKELHHVAEAAFKAVGRALKKALEISGNQIASTKGSL